MDCSSHVVCERYCLYWVTAQCTLLCTLIGYIYYSKEINSSDTQVSSWVLGESESCEVLRWAGPGFSLLSLICAQGCGFCLASGFFLRWGRPGSIRTTHGRPARSGGARGGLPRAHACGRPLGRVLYKAIRVRRPKQAPDLHPLPFPLTRPLCAVLYFCAVPPSPQGGAARRTNREPEPRKDGYMHKLVLCGVVSYGSRTTGLVASAIRSRTRVHSHL